MQSLSEKFSVWQFFPDETYEKVRSYVGGEEAVTAAMHYATSVGARMGTTRRVIITDGGDFTVWEWKFEEGITFPEEFKGRLKRGIANANRSSDREDDH
jgi:hypothetical protein